jgi:hypothetical protein
LPCAEIPLHAARDVVVDCTHDVHRDAVALHDPIEMSPSACMLDTSGGERRRHDHGQT